jgi:hypothetical protein
MWTGGMVSALVLIVGQLRIRVITAKDPFPQLSAFFY